MIEKRKLLQISDFITNDKDHDKFIKFVNDRFNPDLDEDDVDTIEEMLTEVIGEIEIVIDPKETYIVKEYDSGDKVVKLKEKLQFPISEVFDAESYMNNDFFVIDNQAITINASFDTGEIADAISDETGWLVDSVVFELSFKNVSLEDVSY